MSLFLPALSRAQDVAEAARQEKARKEAQTKKSRHVYTNEDLSKKEILDPADRAEVEARKKEIAPAPAAPPAATDSTPAVDSDNAQSSESLGEVARRYRAEKVARQAEEALRNPTPFPMNIEQPALAHPVQPVEHGKKLRMAAPKFEAPRISKSPALRDPFSRGPVAPRQMISPAAPSVVVKPKAFVLPSTAPLTKRSEMSAVTKSGLVSTAKKAPVTPNTIVVKSGDSLWKLSKHYLGTGSRWQEFLAVNSNMTDPGRIQPGAVFNLPAAASSTKTMLAEKSNARVKVQKGDSLWKIAQEHLGSGNSWSCMAQANPSLRNPNQIFAGQTLLLPASCPSRR